MARRRGTQREATSQVADGHGAPATGRVSGGLLSAILVAAAASVLYVTTQRLPVAVPSGQQVDLRALLRRGEWAEVTAVVDQFEGSSPNQQLVALLPVAVAARGFSELTAAGGLRELCTGCTMAEKATEADYIQALTALAPHQRPEDIVSAVFTSIRTRDLAALNILLELWPASAGARFSARDPTTPLHVAVSTSSEVLALSKKLLNGHDPGRELWDWLDQLGSNTAIIRKEAAAGEVEATSLRVPITAWTCQFVLALLAAEAAPSARDQLGRTPLHVASFVGNQCAINALLNATDDSAELADAVDSAGNSATDLALVNSFAGTARLLRERWGTKVTRNTKAIVASLNRTIPQSDVEVDDDAGGWGAGGIPQATSDTKTIDTISVLDRKQFVSSYLIPRQPVLFRGGCANWTTFRKMLAKDRFIELFGDRTLPVSTIPYGSQYSSDATGIKTGRRRLRAFVEEDMTITRADHKPLYVFEQQSLQTVLPEVSAVVPRSLPWLVGATMSAPQFYVGGNGSGAPPHFHGDAWNALAWGSKRWFLFPPHEARFSRVAISDWVASRPTPPAPFEVLQQSGDILYVPKGWAHGVLNLSPSVGVACEFDSIVGRY